LLTFSGEGHGFRRPESTRRALEAELIVGMLRSHGVSAAVSADDAGGQYPQMQIEGVRVLVAPSDETSARQLLADADDSLS
jgi:predicted Fe-Mo cluster-binding NifX family protein